MFCLPRILPEPVFFCFLFFLWFCLIFFPKALESLYLSTTGSDWTDNEHWVCALMLWDFPFFMTDFLFCEQMNDSISICDWSGVQCIAPHVMVLNLFVKSVILKQQQAPSQEFVYSFLFSAE